MITKAVNLWLGNGPRVVIPVSQFDTMWQFTFAIVKDGLTWEIPSGASAVLNGLKPDGNVFAFSGTISGNTVTVNCDVQMTAVAGDTICELSILADGKTVGTANFTLAVEAAPKSPEDVSSDSTLPAYAEMLEMFSGDIEDEVDNWLNAHSSQIGGLTNEAKQALLTLLAHVAYTDDQGQTYLDALETALYPPANLVSISAVFEQGSAVIYDTDDLDTLKQYLTVTANYSDSTTEVVTAYTLSGTLTEGTSTITVTYGGKTDTFNVTVTAHIINGWLYRFEQNLNSDGTNDFGWSVSGTAAYDTGHDGTGYCYYNANGALVAQGYTAPDLSGDFTIAWWTKSTSAMRGQGISPYIYDNTSGEASTLGNATNVKSGYSVTYSTVNKNMKGCRVSYVGQKIQIRLITTSLSYGRNYTITPPSSYDSTQWHHWAITRKSGTLRFFIDGEVIFELSTSSNLLFNTLVSFGGYFDSAGATTPTGYSSYPVYLDDLYIAETCKWDTDFDPSAITY